MKSAAIYLHCALLGLPPGDSREGDHKDRNRLNNRRSNLRIVPAAGNRQNVSKQEGRTSQYRGVSFNKREQKWKAYVKADGKMKGLGTFTTEEEAAEAAREGRSRYLPFSVD